MRKGFVYQFRDSFDGFQLIGLGLVPNVVRRNVSSPVNVVKSAKDRIREQDGLAWRKTVGMTLRALTRVHACE